MDKAPNPLTNLCEIIAGIYLGFNHSQGLDIPDELAYPSFFLPIFVDFYLTYMHLSKDTINFSYNMNINVSNVLSRTAIINNSISNANIDSSFFFFGYAIGRIPGLIK